MRLLAWALLGACVGLAGCVTHQTGPVRPITIDDDVGLAKDLVYASMDEFVHANPARQAFLRNQIITARMYIADVEYHFYEAQFTKEMQNEGLGATAVNLGLTTTASLVPVAQTTRLLSGLAAATTGLDKAYIEKELLSHTIQTLQTQMRADRKEQAATIYTKMLTASGEPTPISQYPLAIALSDQDTYYQAGTLTSAIIGLSKTVAAKEEHSDQAKALAGPNGQAVLEIKEVAKPQASAPVVLTASARDAAYFRLRGLMLAGTADQRKATAAYVEGVLGSPAVHAGLILNDAYYAPLYGRISNCIQLRNAGTPCAAGSLQKFRK